MRATTAWRAKLPAASSWPRAAEAALAIAAQNKAPAPPTGGAGEFPIPVALGEKQTRARGVWFPAAIPAGLGLRRFSSPPTCGTAALHGSRRVRARPLRRPAAASPRRLGTAPHRHRGASPCPRPPPPAPLAPH